MHPPQVPFVSSLTGTWITDEQATSPDYWVQQVRRAVRFSSGIAELLHDPANILVEVGPGQTLSTLARQHPAKQAAQEIVASLKSEENVKPDLQSKDTPHKSRTRSRSMLEAVGRIWTAGGSVDWARFHGNEARQRVPLPTYPFERQRYWIDSPVAGSRHQFSHGRRDQQIQRIAGATDDSSSNRIKTRKTLCSAQQEAALVKLRALFSDISGLSADQLIASAPFLEIGLDSLLLTQASTAIEKSFGVHVTFRQLLEELSSLDALAAHLAPSMPAPLQLRPLSRAPVSMPRDSRFGRNDAPLGRFLLLFHRLFQGGVEALVRKQLEIMEKQLEMLAQSELAQSAIPAAAISRSRCLRSSQSQRVRRIPTAPRRKQFLPAPAVRASRSRRCPGIWSVQASTKRRGRCAAGPATKSA